MNNSPDLQETRKLESIKSFEDLSDEQREKIENDLIWRFLEKYYRKIYNRLFTSWHSDSSELWLGQKSWRGTDNLPELHQKEMSHFREVLARLRKTSFTIDVQGEVQFDLEAVLTGQQGSGEDDFQALSSLTDADWEMDFSGVFIDEDKDDQATIPLKPVS